MLAIVENNILIEFEYRVKDYLPLLKLRNKLIEDYQILSNQMNLNFYDTDKKCLQELACYQKTEMIQIITTLLGDKMYYSNKNKITNHEVLERCLESSDLNIIGTMYLYGTDNDFLELLECLEIVIGKEYALPLDAPYYAAIAKEKTHIEPYFSKFYNMYEEARMNESVFTYSLK